MFCIRFLSCILAVVVLTHTAQGQIDCPSVRGRYRECLSASSKTSCQYCDATQGQVFVCGMDEREKFLGSLCASEFDPDDDDDNPLVRNIPSPEDCNKDVCNTFCNEYGPGEGVRRMQCVYGGQFCQCEGDYRIEVVVSNAPPLGASIMLLGLGLALFLTVFSVL